MIKTAGAAKANLDWPNLAFGYTRTDFNIRYICRDGVWSEGVLTAEETLPLHIAATCLHYGQECFEGLKAFERKDGEVVVFRPDENALRMRRTAERILLAQPPVEMFLEGVYRVLDANRRFIPPYGTGAAMYIRPLLIGAGSEIGVKPAREYYFVVFVMPVGPYFKSGFKPVDMYVEERCDRAAPLGVGDVKVGGNYAAALRASTQAKQAGYADALFLDAKEKKYIEESAPANFFGITADKRYVTPASQTILPSITNKSLVTLAEEMGLRPERRQIPIEEIFALKEAGCCGTAAVITPIGSITLGNRKAVYCPDGKAGPHTTALYNRLRAIQVGDEPDTHDWLHVVPRAR
jgi:branched-chain amino acid aminotransferase